MPFRGERTAPKFDSNQPRTLVRYFEDLEELFDALANPLSEETKKFNACKFIDIDVADSWKNLASYEDTAKSYVEFRDDVYALYPGVKERRWKLADLEAIVERRRLGQLTTEADYAEYWREFTLIGRYLVGKDFLGKIEMARWFYKGLPDTMKAAVDTRLSQKLVDHLLDEPYTLEEYDAAVRFLLSGSPSVAAPVVAPNLVPTATPNPLVTLTNAAGETELLALLRAIAANSMPVPQQPRAMRAVGQAQIQQIVDDTCHYCNTVGCRIRGCPRAAEDIQAGKVRRDASNRLVLSNGQQIPSGLPGNCMRDRVNEWHRLYPGQMVLPNNPAVAGMLYTVDTNPRTVRTYTLTAEERLASLEREINALRQAQWEQDKTRSADSTRQLPTGERARPPHEARRSTPEPTSQPPPPRVSQSSGPPAAGGEPSQSTRPFAAVKDTSYLPPKNRNVGAKDTAYKTTTPIQEPKLVDGVYDKTLQALVGNLTVAEVLAVAPDLRNRLRTAVTPRRIASDTSVKLLAIDETGEDESDDVDGKGLPAPPFAAYTSYERAELPRGAIRCEDPVEQRFLEHREVNSMMIVAKESHALRLIECLVDNKLKVDCVIDPGCQIVAMSEEVCTDLNLVYDPSIKVSMVSANSTTDTSLGLARDVPFTIGPITLYMQAHIIRNASYDVLLGRPFDVVTSSIVQNSPNEDQTITIHCRNSGLTASIPTKARPQGGPERRRRQDFRDSRN
ncbi:hypothetical protein C8Q80DRAFT_1094759 [Daedaleopsis nitida]|nr:hypothetical protein C8Q80DRAFT_1094759 [Daedaleopsis nitida]